MSETTRWRDCVAAQFQQSIETPTRFFDENADHLAQASLEMARRFQRGGRLLVFGNGSSTTDAQHVSVEFVHPVIVGKRALSAMALTNDVAAVLGMAQHDGLSEIFARQLSLLGRGQDIALGLSIDGRDQNIAHGLVVAQEMGMLTIGMCGMDGGAMLEQPLRFCFAVSSHNPHVVQEVQETAYHVLWETVHVFFEHEGLLEEGKP